MSGTLWLFGMRPIGRRTALLPLVAGTTFVVETVRKGHAAVIAQWDVATTAGISAMVCFVIAFLANWMLAPWRLEREARDRLNVLTQARGDRELRLRVCDLMQHGEAIRGAIGVVDTHPSDYSDPDDLVQLGVNPWLYEVDSLLAAADPLLARHFDGTERFFPRGSLHTYSGLMSLIRLRLERLRDIRDELERAG